MLTQLAIALLASMTASAQVIITPPTPIPTGQVGTNYSATFTASGGVSPYSWAIFANNLPYGSGWSITAATSTTGTLTGLFEGCVAFWGVNSLPCANPIEPMTGSVTLTVSDSTIPIAQTATQTFGVPVDWNPSQASYLSTQYANFAQMAAVPGSYVPPLLGGGHLVIANPIFRNISYDDQPSWNAWVDAMKAAGMSIVNIEVDLECLLSARTSCLNLYKGAIAHAHELGMTVSINPPYYGTQSCGDAGCPTPYSGQSPPALSTGMTGACYAPLGSNNINYTTVTTGGTTYGSGVSDWYKCLVTYAIPALNNKSAYQYMIENWLQGYPNPDRFVPVHEPTTQAAQWNEGTQNGGCSHTSSGTTHSQSCSGQALAPGSYTYTTCPNDWMVNFLQPFFAAATSWAVPTGLQYGVTVNATEMQASPTTYQSAFTSLPSTINMGLDMYDFGPARQTLYEGTISTFSGHNVFVEEFGPEAWTNATGPYGESCAIVGLQSCTWNNMNQNLFSSLLPFLASLGIANASLYGTEILAACAPAYPDNGQDPSVLALVTSAMKSRQYSESAARMAAILSNWNASQLAGGTLTHSSLIP